MLKFQYYQHQQIRKKHFPAFMAFVGVGHNITISDITVMHLSTITLTLWDPSLEYDMAGTFSFSLTLTLIGFSAMLLQEPNAKG